MVALAERLCALSGQDRAFFCNSGAEAVEAAIKLARRTGRARGGPAKHRIVCVEGAFHGRTLATLAAGWSAAKREPFEPVPAGFEHVPRNDLAALAAAVGPDTCAVLVEPIQGEGGVWPIDTRLARARARAVRPPRRAAAVRRGADGHRPLRRLVLRASCAGVRPDAIAVAKGLAGGLPIGALLATDMPDAGFERGDHATTFGGSPPIAAAALAVLDAIEREGLVENARDRRRAHRRARRRPARRRSRARSRAAARNRARRRPGGRGRRARCERAGSSSTRSRPRPCGWCRHCASRRAKPTVSVPRSRPCWPLAATSVPPRWHKPEMR